MKCYLAHSGAGELFQSGQLTNYSCCMVNMEDTWTAQTHSGQLPLVRGDINESVVSISRGIAIGLIDGSQDDARRIIKHTDRCALI